MEQERKLKLNVKNTFKIAFAFFGILMLWSVYNTYCPIILEAMLGPKHDYLVGVIMALDNVAALLIMPVFGKLSDKTNTKWGKRMPYIVIGMALTAVVFPFIALMCMWNSLAGVIVFMLLFLIIMQAYRNPAVALMPDITPKPLRSKANGIINLIGYIGGVFATVIGMLPFFKMNASSSLADIQSKVLWPFAICTVVFIGVLIFLILKVKEKKLLDETKDDVAYGETLSDTEEIIDEDNRLSKTDKRNLLIILAAVFLWFMSFNAFETFGSLFFKNVVGDSTLYSLMSTVLSVVSIVSFVLFSGLSSKIGRKWTVVIGIVSMVVSLGLMTVISLAIKDGGFLAEGTDKVKFVWKLFFIAMSAIMGFGWALININSFPMVVEYSNSKNLGKFTGYYYMASMLAQTITPILIGLIMDQNKLGQRLLFVYSAILMALAFLTFFFVKEKMTVKERLAKAKLENKKSALERLGDMDD